MLRLDLVVGPNGAGKSTFVRKSLLPALPPGTPFVNADEIAAQRWPHDPEGNSYEAARVAAATRVALIEAGRPFVAETVFSHPSKLELLRRARTAGFTVGLHVLLVPEQLSVERVLLRVEAGGHSVPEDKIRGRHRRLAALVAAAMTTADATVVYDNSAARGPRVVARGAAGVPYGVIAWPSWAPVELASAWPATRGH